MQKRQTPEKGFAHLEKRYQDFLNSDIYMLLQVSAIWVIRDTSIWALILFNKCCDICKDFRLEIPERQG